MNRPVFVAAMLFGATSIIGVACGGTAVVDGSAGGAGGTTTTNTTTDTTTTTTTGFADCDGPGQCTLTWTGCCEGCGIPELDDVVPVALAQLEAFRDQQCPVPEACPACASCLNGNLFAYCDEGTCRSADLRDHPFSECSAASDCTRRAGTNCCESCGNISVECGGLVAINAQFQDDLASLVCEDDSACPPCAPIYPDEAFADCDDGRCTLVISNQ